MNAQAQIQEIQKQIQEHVEAIKSLSAVHARQPSDVLAKALLELGDNLVDLVFKKDELEDEV